LLFFNSQKETHIVANHSKYTFLCQQATVLQILSAHITAGEKKIFGFSFFYLTSDAFEQFYMSVEYLFGDEVLHFRYLRKEKLGHIIVCMYGNTLRKKAICLLC